MNESLALEILAKVKAAPRVGLVLHQNPDADSLGAAAAFAIFLNSLAIPYSYYCFTPLPPEAAFFGINALATTSSDFSKEEIICVFDAGDMEHAGLDDLFNTECFHAQHSVLCRKPFIVNFDHHSTNTHFGHINIVDPACSSTTEVLYNFFKTIKYRLNARAASYLLAGIMADTDYFQNPATTHSALETASKLMATGAAFSQARAMLFECRDTRALRLIGDILSRLKKNDRYDIVITYITEQDAHRHGLDLDDLHDTANILNAVDNARAMVILKSSQGIVRASMRTTRTDIDLGRLATVCGGGGHCKAAGFRLRGSLQQQGDSVKVV